jgi:hypothetical protein
MPRLKSFMTPSVHELQQLVLVGLQLLEGLAFDARDHSGDKPARQAHLQTDDILPRNSCLRLSSDIHIIRSLEGGSPFYGA